MRSRRLLQRMKKTIRTHAMTAPGDAVLIAVSGGPDSVALLYLMRMVATEMGLRLGMIHLNHGLRETASDSDAEFVRSLAARLQLPFFEKKADVNGFRKTHRLSLEEAARRVRYAYFEETAQANRYDKVALGHHSDDNAELVLMNLLRGSGPQGLSGIPPVREGRYIRPLIDLKREDLKGFLDEHDIPCIRDASNQDLDHRRNRIRHELLPLMRSVYNPDVSQSLSRLAAIMRDENQWMDGLAEKAFMECRLDQADDHLTLSTKRLAALDPPLLKRVLRKAILEIKHDLRRIRFAHIDAVCDVLLGIQNSGPTEKEIHLPDGIRVRSARSRLIIKRMASALRGTAAASDPNFHEFCYRIPKPNRDTTLYIPEVNGRMSFSILPGPALPAVCSSPAFACFDLDALIFPLIVRPPRPGDRFEPLGMGGSQKIKDYFINHKIPGKERKRRPLLISGDAIIWLAGHRTAEFGKVTDKTQNILKVELSLA